MYQNLEKLLIYLLKTFIKYLLLRLIVLLPTRDLKKV